MQSGINFFILIVLAGSASVGFAREAAASPERPVSSREAEEGVLPFPYVAEITGNDVYIRSGPGTEYYTCGKLNKTDRVKVVSSQPGWSRIVPPPGSFSWITTQFVSIDQDSPAIGIVTGDRVRVYAGSAYIKPIHSTTEQVKLNRGDKVRLLGEERTGYYKIASPADTYLWVSTKFTKAVGPVGEVPVVVGPRRDTTTDANMIVPTDISVQAKKLEEYHALEKQIQAERAKPIEQQSYTKIKKALVEIASNKRAGKAARYAEFGIKQVERFELALAIAKEVWLQDAQLQRIQERINKARATRLAAFEDLGRFAVIGKFKTSSVYGAEPELIHYRIIDGSNKILCYALPSGPASRTDLSKLVGLKVGLLGTIEPHPQTQGALVRFTGIVKLN